MPFEENMCNIRDKPDWTPNDLLAALGDFPLLSAVFDEDWACREYEKAAQEGEHKCHPVVWMAIRRWGGRDYLSTLEEVLAWLDGKGVRLWEHKDKLGKLRTSHEFLQVSTELRLAAAVVGTGLTVEVPESGFDLELVCPEHGRRFPLEVRRSRVNDAAAHFGLALTYAVGRDCAALPPGFRFVACGPDGWPADKWHTHFDEAFRECTAWLRGGGCVEFRSTCRVCARSEDKPWEVWAVCGMWFLGPCGRPVGAGEAGGTWGGDDWVVGPVAAQLCRAVRHAREKVRKLPSLTPFWGVAYAVTGLHAAPQMGVHDREAQICAAAWPQVLAESPTPAIVLLYSYDVTSLRYPVWHVSPSPELKTDDCPMACMLRRLAHPPPSP